MEYRGGHSFPTAFPLHLGIPLLFSERINFILHLIQVHRLYVTNHDTSRTIGSIAPVRIVEASDTIRGVVVIEHPTARRGKTKAFAFDVKEEIYLGISIYDTTLKIRNHGLARRAIFVRFQRLIAGFVANRRRSAATSFSQSVIRAPGVPK